MPSSRRRFTAEVLASLTMLGLVEALWSRELVAAKVRPNLGRFFRELHERVVALRGGRMSDLEFQAVLAELLGRVDVRVLGDWVALDEIERRGGFAETGATVRDFGLPAELGLARRLFACRKGRAIVPHGHVNIASGFVVLRGQWRGRHYERIETQAEHVLIRPTIDRAFLPGEPSTVSEHGDNVHWFQAESDPAFIFNVHLGGYDPTIAGRPGRVFLDPEGERLAGGLIRAPKLTREACLARFGG